MDPLSDVLSFLRLTSYRVGGFTAGGDWSLGFDAQANIKQTVRKVDLSGFLRGAGHVRITHGSHRRIRT